METIINKQRYVGKKITLKTELKVGDKVIRTKKHNNDRAFAYGGKEDIMPIGTVGEIHNFYKGKVDDNRIIVNFKGKDDNIHRYEMAHTELELLTLDETYQSEKLTFNAKTGMKEYIRNLMKSITDDKERTKGLETFQNCVLSEEVRNTVDEALITVLSRNKFVEWGINDHFEKGITNAILLYGPPGTGKTMISESIASVLGMDLMKLGSGEIQSNVPGQTERNIQKAFKQAKDSNAIVMFDECDSLLSNRDMVGVIMGAEINCLLTELERFDGVVLFTTNRIHMLDPALERRIVSKVKLENPTTEVRMEIWQKLMPPKMPIKNIDFNVLSEAELTGGEIKNCILVAAKKAIVRGQDVVTMKEFEDAVFGVLKSKTSFRKGQESNKHKFLNLLQGIQKGD